MPVGALLNFFSQQSTNAQNRNFSREQMHQQREWALQDRDHYEDYNSPVAQMERLKQAGLNPNLIYGSSPGGAAGGTDIPSGVGANSVVSQAPMFGSVLGEFYNVMKNDAEIDNIEADTAAKVANATNIEANTANVLWNTDRSKSLFAGDAEMQRESIRGKRVGTDIKLSQEHRDAMLQGADLNTKVANLLKLEADTAKSKAEKDKIKMLTDLAETDMFLNLSELEMRASGSTWSAKPLERMVVTWLSKFIGPDGSIDISKIRRHKKEMRGKKDLFKGMEQSLKSSTHYKMFKEFGNQLTKKFK